MDNTLSTITFGPFRLLPQRRLLLAGEQPLRLGQRAFDLLLVLVERAGEVVSNAELMAGVWRDSVVESGSLRMHIAALRKALGDGAGTRYIVNVPLKGYAFVAPVVHVDEPASPASHPPRPPLDTPARAGTLPALLTRLVGRDEVADDLILRLPRSRCVTLVGAGGIGKTSLALLVAHALAGVYPQGVTFVELAVLADGRKLPATLASALGVAVPADDPVRGLAAFLKEKDMLVVLDNCEHVIAEVAEMVEHLLAAAPRLGVLVTSREPMHIPGEWVQRLAALQVPARWHGLTPGQALAFPAVQLFCDRASASQDDFVFGEAELPLVCELCQRLDGLPLAIEIAAASIDRLGLRGLCETLGSCLAGMMRGRRTALPRHQTLHATLEWSHALLGATEQALFRRLSVFAGVFGFRAAATVCAQPGDVGVLPLADVAADLDSLVAKSLVVADISGPTVHYRLLETSRAYAREQLFASPEAAPLQRRHAQHMAEVFAQAEEVRAREPLAAWQARFAPTLGDLRAALAWSFSASGDPHLGLALAADSAPVWFDFSLMAEYRELAEQVLAAMPGLPGSADSVPAMKIHEAYGHALWHTRGGGPAMAETFRRALELAQRLGSPRYQQRALWGLWLICNTTGDSAGSVRLAEQFGRVTGPGTDDSGPTHDRMMALGLHFHGEFARAGHHARRVLEHQSRVNRVAQNSGFQFDQRVAALTVLARTLWIHGQPDQALRHGEQAVAEAQGVGHALSLCYALSNGAIPAAFWAGDLATAGRWTRLLLACATEHSLVFWQAFGEGYDLLLTPQDSAGNVAPGRSLERLSNPATSPLLRDTLCTIDGRLFDDGMLARVGVSGWCAAEMMRLRAEHLLQRQGPAAADAARAQLNEALVLARRQQAWSWALRCAESLARLSLAHGNGEAARLELQALADRFTEGRGSTDLLRIEALLGHWPGH